MINIKDLSLDQLLSLYHMANFNCARIDCEDCPLFDDKHGCGSQQAQNIIEKYEKKYEKETKQ